MRAKFNRLIDYDKYLPVLLKDDYHENSNPEPEELKFYMSNSYRTVSREFKNNSINVANEDEIKRMISEIISDYLEDEVEKIFKYYFEHGSKKYLAR